MISLAIAIAITKSPASGFTILRPQNILDSVPDIEPAESTQLEVRYDLKTLKNSKEINTSKNDVVSDSTVIALNDPKNVDKKIDINENIATTPQIVKETTVIQTQKSENRIPENRSDTSIVMSTEAVNYSYTTLTPSTSQTTTKEPEKIQEFSTKPTTETIIAMDSQISKEFSIDDFLEQEIKENETTENPNHFETNLEPVHQTFLGEKNYSVEIQDMANVSNNSTNTSKIDQLNNMTTADSSATRKDVARSILVTNNPIMNNTTVTEGLVSLNEPNQTSFGLNVDTESTITSTATSLDTTTTSSSDPIADVTKVMFETTTTEVYITTESYNTETVTADYNPSTLPPWKIYTTIDRKRTSTEDTTASDKDMASAETAQTRVSLEKAFSNTPIPSIEKLQNDLINAQVSTTKKLETINATETNVTSAPNIETSTTPKMTTASETETSKLEIVSKRAGYIDNKETTTPKPEEATTSEYPAKVSANDTEMFSAMYETEPGEVDVTENKNATGFESQSQLVS